MTTPEQSIKGNYNFTKMKFADRPLFEHKTPYISVDSRNPFVQWGKKNDYPDYLGFLYNRCATHQSIINSKKTYILGGGWKVRGDVGTIESAKTEQLIRSVNLFQSLDEFTEEMLLQWLVYGNYAIRVKWGLTGEIVSMRVQPTATVRANKDKTLFYISKEWTKEMSLDPMKWRAGRMPHDVETLPTFNAANRKGEQILYCSDYNPYLKVYGLPEYEGAIAAIESEIEMANFDINNIKSGFSAGTMVVMMGGMPTSPDAKDQIERQLKEKLTGTDNAGEIVLIFQDPGTAKPEILRLQADNLADQFKELSPRITQQILTGHSVTSGMLFGIKETGQLGGTTELKNAWEIFYNSYVLPRKGKIERDLNYMASFMGVNNSLELMKVEPIGLDISALIPEALNLAEKRRLVLDTLGIEPIEPTQMHKCSTEKDPILEKLMKFGEDADLFEVEMEGESYEFSDMVGLTEEQNLVYKALAENKRLSLPELSKKTGISQARLINIMEALQKGNYINSRLTKKADGVVNIRTEIGITPIEPEKEEGYLIETKWRYSGPDDDKVREYCRELLKSNRLYTRLELEQLTNDMDEFNTNVFIYRGGWYHNPDTGINTPYCRHTWKAIITRRKTG